MRLATKGNIGAETLLIAGTFDEVDIENELEEAAIDGDLHRLLLNSTLPTVQNYLRR